MIGASPEAYGQFSKLGSLLGPFLIRVPYYTGDLKRDPNLENYPYDATGVLQPGWQGL